MLLIIKRVKLIGKKKFIPTTYNLKYKAFVIYITTFNIDSSNKIHPLKKASIANLQANKTLTKVSNKYTDFADILFIKIIYKAFGAYKNQQSCY